MKHLLSLSIFVLLAIGSSAQKDSTKKILKGSFDYDFYVDAYYSYDLNQPYSGDRPDFLFQYGKNNAISLNMAMARVGYTQGNFSANLGLNTGDFPESNMAHEDALMRMLYEANISYRFLKKFEFTIGMFSSHMGFESALSFDNLLTSHSLASEWTPYYLAGAKLEYMATEKIKFGFTVANGNQSINENQGNTNKLLGLQAEWKPSENLTINYSNMYYNDNPDSAKNMVLYNNLYATLTLIDKLDLVGGFDYAIINNENAGTTNSLYVISALARYRLTDKFAVAGRFEHYNDENNEFISTPLGFGFVTNCYSLNFDYSPIENIKFRLEGRMFDNDSPTYRDDTGFDPNTSTTLTYTTQNANILFSVQAKF